MKRSNNNDSVFSRKIRAGKRRTYYIDVRQTRGNDYYITMTESTRKFHGGKVERHKIFLYKEDFNRFLQGLEECVNHIKTNLMPEFDYEDFDRRQEEWEASQEGNGVQSTNHDNAQDTISKEALEPEDDDMSW